ncbi:GT4 family glycosyltransferase PelF [Corynebacterium cystitidis]|uniref:GT4 family glycosyltransferase PelF n=1 Tax=Corynebacterium cystitidis TaxID=35757 RepID=UPI00211DFCFB|nr:GT4 family glycosyltransferase PelF [Corynebacterium cystitidis]
MSTHYYSRFPGDNTPLEPVDVAIVMESTYPYLKGGVSAVVHDIITFLPDFTFGIIHIAWGPHSPLTDLYEVPHNVAWIDVLYLDLRANENDFLEAVENPPKNPRKAVKRMDHALRSLLVNDVAPFWELYDDSINPQTRTWRFWSLLKTPEFMQWAMKHGPQIPLSKLYWVLRDFFSLAYAVSDRVHPPARVYHAHTTGYASLIASCAAQQNNGAFLLTEHNLYVRDTVNTLLERNMSQIVTRDTYKEIDDPVKRMWTIWWTEMGAMFYPSADAITYLYDRAIVEAQDLGGIPEKSIVLPNGMDWDKFAHTRALREGIVADIAAGKHETWRFACIARVVPIKGIIELIDTMANLRGQGYTNVIMEVCGPTEHIPDYYQECLQHTRDLGLEDTVIFRGTVNLVDELERYDGLVLSSFNEGQPIVVLEAMSAGLPVIATNVGGLEHMVTQPVGADGQVGPCGALVPSGDPAALAYEIARLVDNPELYMQWHRNGYDRIHSEFLMENIMDRYADLYVGLGG